MALRVEYGRPKLARYQLDAFFRAERYALVEASTKAGKTAACLVWLFEQAARLTSPGASVWWVAPVSSQAEIAYRRMKRGIPREIFKCNDTEHRIELLHNGAMLWFKTGEKPDNLYGEDVHAAVIDEASRVRQESWNAVRSTLTATRGPIRIVGNVKGRANWFYLMARRAQRGADGMHYAKITCHDAIRAGILKQAEIDDARANYHPSVFRELYEAEPSDLTGLIYSAFSAENYDGILEDDGTSELLVGMDFNVSPMTATISRKVVDELHLFDEVVLMDSNTEQMAREIRNRYPEPRSIIVYPDPAGNSRKTSSPVGQTDFAILRQFGFKIDAPKAHSLVADRINNVNALCCNAQGRRRLRVNPSRCRFVVAALESMTYKPETSIPDERIKGADGIGLIHISDALGYMIDRAFPIRTRSRGFGLAPEDLAEAVA